MSDAATATPPAADQAPTASSDEHQQLPAGAPPASSSSDRPPRRERSGAAKRKARKARASASSSKQPSAGAALNAELRKLEGQLEALLVSPAVPMHMAGDEWAAEHVEGRGPELAHQVVELARRNVAFRAQLQRLLAVNENAQLGLAAFAYLLPLLIYYGFVPAPPIVKAQLKVPDRAAARVVVQEDYVPPVGSEDAPPQARPGAFAEQPPGTPGAAPAAAPGAAPTSG